MKGKIMVYSHGNIQEPEDNLKKKNLIKIFEKIP